MEKNIDDLRKRKKELEQELAEVEQEMKETASFKTGEWGCIKEDSAVTYFLVLSTFGDPSSRIYCIRKWKFIYDDAMFYDAHHQYSADELMRMCAEHISADIAAREINSKITHAQLLNF